MEAKIEDLKFYKIDYDYMKYLYNIDTEVYFTPAYKKSTKPFIGIIVGLGKYKYFIPITSAKEKHKRYANKKEGYYLIYEYVQESYDTSNKKGIYKSPNNGKKMSILSVLEYKKMIPVPEGLYSALDVTNYDDMYRDLLRKEYQFCLNIKKGLEEDVLKLYLKQKDSGKVIFTHCNYTLLEEACDKYAQNREIA